MMAKVWNDNRFTHTEKFKGDTVSIKPGEFIEMEYMDAVQFKGQMSPISRDADGAPRPESFKMIRVEPIKDDKEIKASEALLKDTCQMCSYKAADQVDLAKHILENHADNIADKSREEAGRKLQEALKTKRA